VRRSLIVWGMLLHAAMLAAQGAAAGAARAQDPLAAELPDGEGKRILIASCISCHGLDYVAKLRGYYSREQWRDVVNTMVEYGTALKAEEQEVLVDYLFQHFGKKPAIEASPR
jgi:mono/diheme cytochrome c family protein